MLQLERLTTGSRSLLYPVRGSLLPDIKHERLQLFRSIVGSTEDDQEELELTFKEFLILSTFFQLNLNYLLAYLDLVTAYGGVFISLGYIILQICIGIPLYCLLTFMSSYAKRSFLKFWDCVPVFHGLGYMIALMRFVVETHNVFLGGIALIHILDLSRSNHIFKLSNCEQENNSVNCISMYPKDNFAQKCPTFYTLRPKNESCYIATQRYFRIEILQYDEYNLRCCTINVKLAVASLFVWVLVFFVSIFGLKRIRHFVINILSVFGVILLIVAFYSILFAKEHVHEISMGSDIKLDEFNIWVGMILHSAEVNLVCNILYLGKLKSESTNLRHVCFLVNLIKILLYLAVVCYTARIRHQVMTHYKILDPKCLISNSHDILFAFVPDVLYRIQFSVIFVVLWYLGLFFFAIFSPILTIIIYVDSLTEKFIKLSKYRLFIFMAICFTGLLINIACFSTNLNLANVYAYKSFAAPFLQTTTLLLLTIALVFIYSMKRIVDDFSFTLGAPPHKYWITFWRTSPIFALFAFIFMVSQLRTQSHEIYGTDQLILTSYSVCIIILLPFGVVFLAKCCKHVKYRTLGALSRPSGQWGPYNQIRKQARKYFYPQRDVKYRSNVLKCKHNCMNSSDKFYEENRKQNQKLQVLIEQMQHEKKSTFRRAVEKFKSQKI